MSSVQDIITGKSELLTAITAYTNAYNNYQGCNGTAHIGGSFVPTRNSNTIVCSTPFTETTKLFDNKGRLASNTGVSTNKSLSDLSMNIHDITTNIGSSISAGKQNIPSDDTLNTDYSNLVNQRSKIDVELQNLYNIQRSVPNMYSESMDYTIYTSILWTVLATSIVYYVFTKL